MFSIFNVFFQFYRDIIGILYCLSLMCTDSFLINFETFLYYILANPKNFSICKDVGDTCSHMLLVGGELVEVLFESSVLVSVTIRKDNSSISVSLLRHRLTEYLQVYTRLHV